MCIYCTFFSFYNNYPFILFIYGSILHYSIPFVQLFHHQFCWLLCYSILLFLIELLFDYCLITVQLLLDHCSITVRYPDPGNEFQLFWSLNKKSSITRRVNKHHSSTRLAYFRPSRGFSQAYWQRRRQLGFAEPILKIKVFPQNCVSPNFVKYYSLKFLKVSRNFAQRNIWCPTL
jgi:hypothetical protein